MEERLKLLIFITSVNGLLFTVSGLTADWLFPMLGWAHNPGFAWGQKIMLLWGMFNLTIAVYAVYDWFRKGDYQG